MELASQTSCEIHERIMKHILCTSKNPNFFSDTIKKVTKGKWSHTAIGTGHILPNGSELCLEASADCGIRPTVISKLIGNHHYEIWETPSVVDFDIYTNEFHGHSYGYPQLLGLWIKQVWGGKTLMRGGVVCNEFNMKFEHRVSGLFAGLDPNEFNPRASQLVPSAIL